jgi:hypothetical protein
LPQSLSTWQLPATHVLPAPSVYGAPWQAQVFPLPHALSLAHAS